MSYNPEHSFLLGGFSGMAQPHHPLVVCYDPFPDDLGLLIGPGLDGHTGRVPKPGVAMQRDFKVAFATDGGPSALQNPVRYQDDTARGCWWAPKSGVVGFHDNRFNGPNTDYKIPIWAVDQGKTGIALAELLAV
jgi:hypothetical protein